MDILEQAYFIAVPSSKPLPPNTTPTHLAELAIESLAGSNIHPIGMIAECRQRILDDPAIKPEIRDLADELLR
ncbi:MAG: hypothetical protein Q8Q90_03300 [bacterium]|nr:hypothetical protein [bacterium]